MKVTIFKDFTNPVENKSLDSIAQDIINGKYKALILEIRNLLDIGQKEEADIKKKKLPAFTPSGRFKDRRIVKNLEEYSGYVHLDFDNIPSESLLTYKEKINTIPYTRFSFISPSGNGLKVFIQTDSNLENHSITYKQIQSFYESELGIQADGACKDINRLCFFSYDSNAYFNQNSKTFKVTIETEGKTESKCKTIGIKSYQDLFEDCILFTNRVSDYRVGNRNNYIHLLACNCNRMGIPKNMVEEFVSERFSSENRSEYIKTISSVYSRNSAEFAKIANSATSQVEISASEESRDYLKSTPLIPEEAIGLMPDFFKECVQVFEVGDERKRDVFLTTAFTVISGCLPDVSGVYSYAKVYPNLFSFVIAPPASGKGILKHAKELGDKVHNKLLVQTKLEYSEYEDKLEKYEKNKRSKKSDKPKIEKPEEPKRRLLFIPADSSKAMVIKFLQDNDGMGIICETEADTMSSNKGQEWGDYSHILRAAFHHEKISTARKSNFEFFEIPEPKLSVGLSGTPSQVPKLIESAEDGLFSRFIFYAFRDEVVWRDPSPKKGRKTYNEHFEALSDKVLDMTEFLRNHPTEVQLSNTQWYKLNNAFTDKLNEVKIFTGEQAANIVYRLGLILYRLCMIFTAVRKFENGECSKELTCIDDDFNASLLLLDVFLDHSLLMYNNLTKESENYFKNMPKNRQGFFNSLPVKFSRAEAIKLGEDWGISNRTVDGLLKTFNPTLLEKIKYGYYRKVEN